MSARWILPGVVAAWMLVCLGSMLHATGGALSMPLDDAYIFFQYARRLAEGAPFSFQEGDPLTAGSTSLLTVVVFAAGDLVGFGGRGMPLFALLVGAACLLWAARSALSIGRRLSPRIPWAPPALLLVSGPVVWAAYSGMDFPIFIALALAVAARWPRGDARPPVSFFVLGALLGTARPDAVFLIAGAFALACLRGRPSPGWAAPLAGAALPFLLQWLVTGTPQSASMDVKSTLGRPDFTVTSWLVGAVAHLSYVIDGVFGGAALGDPARMAANDRSAAALYLFPLALGFLVIAAGPGSWVELRRRRPGVHTLLSVWAVLMVVSQAFTVPSHWHWNRYLIAVYAVAFPVLAVGLDRAGGWIDSVWEELRPGDGGRILAGTAVVLSLPGLVYFFVAYGFNCADIRFQHIALAQRLNQELDPDAVVAVHDVGAITYFGDFRVLDIEGLASPRFQRASRLGAAGVWEAIEAMPPAERPEYLAVYANWYDPVFLDLHRPLYTMRQFKPTIAAGNPIGVYAADWSLSGRGDRPLDPAVLAAVAGCRPAAVVDVADVASERAAGYRHYILDDAYGGAIRNLRSGGGSVVDGGRVISGGERFTGPVSGGGRVLLVARSHGAFRIRVRVDGTDAGLWTAPGAEGDAWVESVYEVPVAVAGDRVSLEFFSDDPHHAAYASYHYWVYRCP
jgi:hypothetical protein